MGCILIANAIILIFSNDAIRLDATNFDVIRLDTPKLLLND
jgi:hypothetical protein